MANLLTNTSELTSIADAIRSKTGKTSSISFPNGFVSEIGSISGGGSSDWEDMTELFEVNSSITFSDFIVVKHGTFVFVFLSASDIVLSAETPIISLITSSLTVPPETPLLMYSILNERLLDVSFYDSATMSWLMPDSIFDGDNVFVTTTFYVED